jgi:putative tricarboxylic transport membrane protein
MPRSALQSVVGVIMLVTAMIAPAAAQQWKPTKPVELVVGSAPGVVNKPGAANTIGWAYLNQHAGDGHYIATFSPAVIGNKLMGTSQLDYTDFTPLNILAREYVVFAVKGDSPITSLKDLTARLKKDSQSVSFAFATARGNHNHIVLSMYLKSIGIDPKTAKAVVYPGGGPAQTAMLGGHIDVYVASPRSMVPLQNEGRARILAISAPQRQTGAKADLPTFRELGHDAVFFTWRGFMGPKGLKAPEIAYWDQVFTKVAQSEEWRKDAEQQMWVADYTLSAETRKHLDREYEVLKAVLTDLGLTKPNSKE